MLQGISPHALQSLHMKPSPLNMTSLANLRPRMSSSTSPPLVTSEGGVATSDPPNVKNPSDVFESPTPAIPVPPRAPKSSPTPVSTSRKLGSTPLFPKETTTTTAALQEPSTEAVRQPTPPPVVPDDALHVQPPPPPPPSV